jgi:HIRAN domain
MTITLPAIGDAWTFEAEDGSTITASGFTLLDAPAGEFLRPHDPALTARGCWLCHVAGVSHRGATLQDPRFAPGSRLTLRSEPSNPHDSNAVAVRDHSGRLQLGYVPAQICSEVSREMRSGRQLGGLVLREYTRGEEAQRVGISILIAPLDTVALDVETPSTFPRSAPDRLA